MKRTTKVNLIFGAIAVGAIIIAIFAVSRVDKHQPDPNAAYIENIRVLNDTIQALKSDIELYKQKVSEIDFERKAIIADLEKVKKEYEKSNQSIRDGGIDDDIRFLTDYLSKKDSDRK